MSILDSLEATSRQNAEGCVKIQEDLDRYRTIIEATKPDVIVETGTAQGGSARWFRSLGPDVITIDVEKVFVDGAGISQIEGSSTDPVVVEHVMNRLGNWMRVMVVLDSDHHADHVAREIELYGPLVTPGCYLVVEDGIVRWMPKEDYPGPLEAISEMLEHNPKWWADHDIEDKFPATMFPDGWWKRTLHA